MNRRTTALLLFAAAAVVAVGLILFGLGTGDPAAVETADRTVVNVERTGASGPAADLTGVEGRGVEGRATAEVAAPSKVRGDVASARPKRVEPDGPYRGRVLDDLGRPLVGIALEFQPWEEANEISIRQFGQPNSTTLDATTDGDGRFVVERSKPLGRTVGIKATARGFLNTPMKHVFDADGASDFGDILLEPAVIVEGWVRDEDERPIAGARVRRIEREGDAMVDMLDQIGFSSMLDLVTTDEEGRFELPHEKVGTIVLLAEHDDIMPARFEGPSKRGGEVLQDIVIVAQRAGVIEGTVVGYPKGRVRGVVAAAAIDPAKDTMAKKGMSAVMSAQLSPAGEHIGKIAGDGTFVIGGLTPGIEYELRGVERRRFVETVFLTDAVEARADGSHVTLQFDAGAEVEFRVIDRATRKPIKDLEIGARWGDRPAKVMLTPDGERIPKRFPDGKVKLHELRPEEDPSLLTVSVDAPGYLRTKSAPIPVGKGAKADGGVVELDSAPRFRFLVLDAATRRPVRRARVELAPTGVSMDPEEVAQRMMNGEIPPREWAKTNREGRCTLPGINSPSVTLEVRARDYATYVEDGFDAMTPRGEIVIEISRGGAIEVAAIDAGGTLIEGVRAECRTVGDGTSWLSGKLTDASGEALFDALGVGKYEVRALRSTAPAFGRQRDDGEDEDWMEAQVVQGRITRVEYELPAVGGLRGVVTMGGEPAVGARVSVVDVEDADETERFIAIQDQFSGFGNQREGDTTGADGSFELSDVEVGRYAVLVRHPDAAMVTRKDVDIDTDVGTIDIEIVLTTIQGKVVDSDGAPVVGAEIAVRRATGEGDDDVRLTRSFLGMSNFTTTTDGDGSYRVVAVKAATPLEVVVRAEGFTDAVSEAVTVAERETRDVKTVEIERAGSVFVTVVGEDEVETQVIFVTATPADEATVADDKIELVRAGRARISGLRAGKWTLQTRGGRRRPGEEAVLGPEKTIDVLPGETVEVELER